MQENFGQKKTVLKSTNQLCGAIRAGNACKEKYFLHDEHLTLLGSQLMHSN